MADAQAWAVVAVQRPAGWAAEGERAQGQTLPPRVALVHPEEAAHVARPQLVVAAASPSPTAGAGAVAWAALRKEAAQPTAASPHSAAAAASFLSALPGQPELPAVCHRLLADRRAFPKGASPAAFRAASQAAGLARLLTPWGLASRG